MLMAEMAQRKMEMQKGKICSVYVGTVTRSEENSLPVTRRVLKKKIEKKL